ncbi:hypothetical protein [Mycoplasma sp. P36-A1]|uniref:hypothetical protein n=1 Tax=Mycoplasma sp. P36-A1 TaxID=3252900 RepID=UPI003C2C6DA5
MFISRNIFKVNLLIIIITSTYGLLNWFFFSQYSNSIDSLRSLYYSINYFGITFNISNIIFIPIIALLATYSYLFLSNRILLFSIGKNTHYYKNRFFLKVVVTLSTSLIVITTYSLIVLIFYLINPEATYIVNDSTISLVKDNTLYSSIEYYIYSNPLRIFIFEAIILVFIPLFITTFMTLTIQDLIHSFVKTILLLFTYIFIFSFILSFFIPTQYNFNIIFNYEVINNFKIYKVIFPYLYTITAIVLLEYFTYDI